MSSPRLNSKSKKSPITLVTINRREEGLKSFNLVAFPEHVYSVNLSNNIITDFDGLPQLSKIRELILDDNPIDSFAGAPYLPSLKILSLKSSILSRRLNFKVMCLVVFGSQITTINGEKIPNKLRLTADSIRDNTLENLVKGQLILRLTPLEMVNSESVKKAQNLIKTNNNQSCKKSIALICNAIQNNELTMAKKDIDNFTRKLKGIRRKFSVPLDQIFDKDEQFSSDASFEDETKLVKVKLQKGIVISDYYYSEESGDEYQRKDPMFLSKSSTEQSSYSSLSS